MFTKPTNIEELKQVFAEILFSKTSEVTKITDGSVLNGVAFGISKIGQKAMKDIALVEASLFPDSAFGPTLDVVAENNGISPRFGALGSSTYLRLVATPGTQYFKNTHTFKGSEGIVFELEDDVLIPNFGFTYAKVKSQTTGLKTNVDSLSIRNVSPTPIGHRYCINEYLATGGRDVETDEQLRTRIKQGVNIASAGTIAHIEQVFMKINPNVLKVYFAGTNDQGKSVLTISSQNGASFSNSELNDLLVRGADFLPLTDLRPYFTNSSGIVLENITYFPIDISFRAELNTSFNPDQVRKEIQIAISKHLDHRFWKPNKYVEWEDLLLIAKRNPGIKYIPDQYFNPRVDLLPQSTTVSTFSSSKYQLPRVRGFLLQDLNGNILSNISGSFMPIYYPAKSDFNYQQTILRSI